MHGLILVFGSDVDFIMIILFFLFSLLQIHNFRKFTNLMGKVFFFFFRWKHWRSGSRKRRPYEIHLVTKHFLRKVSFSKRDCIFCGDMWGPFGRVFSTLERVKNQNSILVNYWVLSPILLLSTDHKWKSEVMLKGEASMYPDFSWFIHDSENPYF